MEAPAAPSSPPAMNAFEWQRPARRAPALPVVLHARAHLRYHTVACVGDQWVHGFVEALAHPYQLLTIVTPPSMRDITGYTPEHGRANSSQGSEAE